MVTSDWDEDPQDPLGPPWPDSPYERVLSYRDALIGFFTGTNLDGDVYRDMRKDLISDPLFSDLAPRFIRRHRDTSSLWSFAKEVDPSWEPRRKWLRAEFEPLLEALENGAIRAAPPPKHEEYDSGAWTGLRSPAQKAQAVKTLVPVAMSAIETLIHHLEAPGHNGGPPLDETLDAVSKLRELHAALGVMLTAVEEGRLKEAFGDGAMHALAKFATRSAKALKNDPVPYALSALLLATLTACGVPHIGGWLGGMAVAMKKPLPD